MKNTLIAFGLALAAGIASAQELPTINITTSNAPVVVLQALDEIKLVAVTNRITVRTTNIVQKTTVDPLYLDEAQMAAVIQMCQGAGISANQQITTSNLVGLTVSKRGGTNSPATFVIYFRIK